MGLRNSCIDTGYQPETPPSEGHRHGYRAIRSPTTSSCEAAASSIRPRASTVSSMSPCATAASPRWARTCRARRRRRSTSRGKLVLPGLIDTHAHVYRYVSGRFGLDADTVGVHSGVTTVVDQGGPSVLTFPGFREYRRQARQHPRAGLHLRLHGGRAGRPLLPRALPARLHRRRRHGARGARERRPGARREGPCRDRRLHALGRRGDAPRRRDRPRARPAALHPFRPALAACPTTSIPTMPTPSCPTCWRSCGRAISWPIPSPAIPAASSTARQGPSGGARGAGARSEDRRRPRLAFLLQDGAAGARGRPRARHAGRRHARLQHDDPQAARHARDASRQGGDAPLRRRAELLARLGHDQHAGAGPLARAGRADGDQQLRRHAGHDGRDRHAASPASRPTCRCWPTRAAASC